MKICKSCEIEYPYSFFYKNKNSVDGHLGECSACRRIKNREIRELNKDKRNLQTKLWKENNKERVKEYRKQYYELNKERQVELYNEWKNLNYSKYRATKNSNNAKRRFNKRQATPWWTDFNRIKEIYSEARRITELTGIPHHVDHIIPLIHEKVQGLHVPCNLQIVPYFYNLSKGNTLIEDIV